MRCRIWSNTNILLPATQEHLWCFGLKFRCGLAADTLTQILIEAAERKRLVIVPDGWSSEAVNRSECDFPGLRMISFDARIRYTLILLSRRLANFAL